MNEGRDGAFGQEDEQRGEGVANARRDDAAPGTILPSWQTGIEI
ncbi:hypothetical protein QH494_24590 [Sphingomonas sp. AR_OL41]|jgi:hypothetical protein|nr:hypothetical protein [Sphingomonas sp. AR_OL41]MDH7975378.1 hypothetical protein [Sphingomonas sp. AR_OL41]